MPDMPEQVRKMAVDKSISILVVDDFQTMTQLMKYLLMSLGFRNIDEARDGSSALSKMAEKSYALVISDWNMEPMSGLEFLRQLRARGDAVPFILVTAEGKTESVIEARAAGVTNYIVKPYNAVTLKSKLVSVLGEF
jgi:two-component system, chemotaxis family, chemotaxis protein CheY